MYIPNHHTGLTPDPTARIHHNLRTHTRSSWIDIEYARCLVCVTVHPWICKFERDSDFAISRFLQRKLSTNKERIDQLSLSIAYENAARDSTMHGPPSYTMNYVPGPKYNLSHVSTPFSHILHTSPTNVLQKPWNADPIYEGMDVCITRYKVQFQRNGSNRPPKRQQVRSSRKRLRPEPNPGL